MTAQPSLSNRTVQTGSGRIAYTEQGTGPVALFVHGVLLNSHLWRHQLAHLSDVRRCIAVDLLAPWRHGDRSAPGRVRYRECANARRVSRCAVDRAGRPGRQRQRRGHRTIFAASYPQRVRSLTLTNCDTHDNWPPEAFKPFLAMAANGGLSTTLNAMLSDKRIYR